MKVLHIIDTIAKKNGGPSRSSQGLIQALNHAGVAAHLLSCAVGDEPWLMDRNFFVAPSAPGLSALKAFLIQTIQQLQPDLIHLHGIWRPENHIAVSVARAFKIPYLFSPRGMLDPWALRQKWWKKVPAWWLYQYRDLKGACAFHATAELEAGNIRKKGFRQPVIICQNGVAVPEKLPARSSDAGTPKTALFLSRLHPGKGLMRLAEAWGRLRPQGWRMRVVGFDGYGEKARVTARLNELNIADWVFEEPMDDVKKWQAFADADLFIHPSASENFGISIAEALFSGLPVITTKGAPWEELETHRCGWWIDLGVDPLAEALKAATDSTLDVLQDMGQRGHRLIAEKYTWPSIGKKMAGAYENLLKD